MDVALADGADMIATGHYASVRDGSLYRGVDENKDQTYFLYRVKKAALQRSLMPIGDYTKPQVRQMAAGYGLPTATKKDSQGICFIGPVGMKSFLQQYVETQPGPILNQEGEEIGQHDGAIFFTIGQRSGLGIGGGKPFYVLRKDMSSNTVVVTDNPDDLELQSDEIQLESCHYIGDKPEEAREYLVRLRHRGELVPGRLENGRLMKLAKPMRALAPGQSAVIYDDRKVIGGGIIASVSGTKVA